LLLSLLAFGARSAVWQEKTLPEIIDSVLGAYTAHAAWVWSPCALQHLEQSHQSGHRSYTVQYRESDLAFVSRLLAREGLVYRFEADDAAPLGQKLVILADTRQAGSCPPDATSAADGGIRFHRASSQERQDAIQVFGGLRQLQAAVSATSVWDYKRKGPVAASVPTAAAFGGPNAPRIAQFESEADHQFANEADAQRAMTLAQEALEARHKTWIGRSTVRSFNAGRQFQLTQSNLDVLASLTGGQGAPDQTRFLLTWVVHAGINNLPKDLQARVAQALGDVQSVSAGGEGGGEGGDEGGDEGAAPLAPWVSAEVAEQARKSGYGNAFEAIRAHVPWRVALYSDQGLALYPTPRPGGPLTATVVGPNGETSASGAGEIHTDRLGRIRIRFDFQDNQAQTPAASIADSSSHASTWVRVMQRFAGPGMGWQFIPRVGQEVLVDFMDGVIERPIVMAALYNGQGEAGISPTPGGQGAKSDTSALAQSSDHRPSAQGNRIGTGHSPAWHGAGAATASAGSHGQANASALNGIKTQEFGASSGAKGYNQLVFDDSNGQLRVQLSTTQHGTQLNLGHLIHQADNHRGSLRGAGFELRTDAYGAIRAASGVLLTTYGPTGTGSTATGQATAEPALDNAAGIALAAQLKTLGQRFNQAADTHQITKLAAHIGSSQAKQSSLAPEGTKPEATLAAWHTSVKGMVQAASFDEAKGDAANKTTDTANTNVPASADAIIALEAKAGWAQTAGQDVQISAAENITAASGQDSHWATGGAFRLHTGQSIGLLAGAVQPGTEAAAHSEGPPAAGRGITLIAAQGDTHIQAQSDTLQIAAKQQLSIQSETAHIDWAAAKKITLATAGGASIVIEGGNITVMCPGTITVKASAKSFSGGGSVGYGMPALPKFVMSLKRDFPFSI
jgi:uncharacterized protein involved in type VI secretion and phage assembly/uncharacterized protein (DUF2345 family)